MNKTLEERLVQAVLDFNDAYSEKLRNAHTELIVRASAGDKKAKRYIKECLRRELIRIDKKYKNRALADEIVNQIYADNWGLGPLDKYDTEDVDELMVNGTKITIQKNGALVVVPEKFESHEAALRVIRRVLEFDSSLDLSEKNPKRQAERMDGARITVSIPPIAKEPTLNIRKHESFMPTTENLIKTGTIPRELVRLMDLAVKGRANIAVIGEMGSGKTALTRWLLGFIPKNQRTGVLETTFEINPEKLYPEHTFVQLRENLLEKGQTLSDLFYLMLRKNVSRIMLGEVRSGTELYMYKYACKRGHSGGIMTGHYMDAESFLTDGADMIMEAGLGNDKTNSKHGLAETVDLVVRLVNIGTKRVVASVEEVIVLNDNDYVINTLWEYVWDENDPTKGRHIQRNYISDKLKRKLNSYGVKKEELSSLTRGVLNG